MAIVAVALPNHLIRQAIAIVGNIALEIQVRSVAALENGVFT